MKNTINTLEDALTLELENLYCTEEKLKSGLTKMQKIVQSEELQDILMRYRESCDHKLMKLDRVFSYLHHEPKACHTNVADELINESFDRMKFAQDQQVRELVLISCIERITNYKTCVYETCLRYAEELDLDIASDLLLMIIQWEKKIKKELVELFYHDFNRSMEPVFI